MHPDLFLIQIAVEEQLREVEKIARINRSSAEIEPVSSRFERFRSAPLRTLAWPLLHRHQR